MSAAAAIARSDARSFVRDPLLRSMLVAPVGLMGLLVVGIPLLEGWLAAGYGLDLRPHRPVTTALLTAVVMPLLFGGFAGLMLVEDRESQVLPAIAVSPAGVRTYLAVRTTWAGLAAFVAVSGALLLSTGVAPVRVAAVAAIAGGSAGVVALLIGSLSADRLEAIAITKAMMLPLGATLLVGFVARPWSWLLAVLPSYGPVAALLQGLEGRPVGGTAIFAAVQLALWAWLLSRRIVRRVG